MRSPSLPCLGKFVIHISCAGVILPLHLMYICVFIYMFVRLKTVYALLFVCMLYNLIVVYTSYWCIWSYISPMCGLFFRCIIVTFTILFICLWMLSLCLLLYFGVLYTIFTLVVLHIGRRVMHIYCMWFVFAIVAILVDLNSQYWINISLF